MWYAVARRKHLCRFARIITIQVMEACGGGAGARARAPAHASRTQPTQRNAIRRTHSGIVTGSSARRYMQPRESINSRSYALRRFEGAKAREMERKMGRATGRLVEKKERG